MILQALAEHYNTLCQKGEIPRPGWSNVKVSYTLVINQQGELLEVVPLKQPQQRGKKTVESPSIMRLPKQVIRTSGAKPNFLCDKSDYILGWGGKGEAQQTDNCFTLCSQLHRQLLADANSPAAQAVVAFFTKWQPEFALQHPALQDYLDEIFAGDNMIFRFQGRFVHEEEEIIQAWEKYLEQQEQGVRGRCLITGEEAVIARLHPQIKGIRGAQSSGASLVSFNASALESYEKTQSYNAPVSESAAFAYTSALNYLLADSEHTVFMGDTTVVYWAESAEPAYGEFFRQSLAGESSNPEMDFIAAMQALAKGRPYEYDSVLLKPETRFYILGLSPNAARLSVRFFYKNSYGFFVRNLYLHHQRLKIIKPAFDTRQYLKVGDLLYETVNKKARDKSAPPVLAGALMRSVLGGSPYPQSLLNSVIVRIRSEHNVTRGQAAIIKAFWLQKCERKQNIQLEEVLTVEYNDDTTYQPYIWGRLFAVLEDLQEKANPGINSTIRDRYFSAAASTPAVIYPRLIRLANNHLKKIDNNGMKINFEKQIRALNNKRQTDFPAVYNLQEQGAFYLGYYHQTQKRYEKKNKEEEK